MNINIHYEKDSKTNNLNSNYSNSFINNSNDQINQFRDVSNIYKSDGVTDKSR